MPAESLLRQEIQEQPCCLMRLVAAATAFSDARKLLRAHNTRAIRLVGHGSSDNAACYGVYAFALLAGLPAVRDSISLPVYYRTESRLENSAVVALSQSGRTPDVVAYVERARAARVPTIALTNDPSSPLAEVANVTVPLLAGRERAIAATKTYTSELAALAILAAHLGGRAAEVTDAIRRLVETMAAHLREGEFSRLEKLASVLAHAGRMFVVGRGFEYATARELALKLTETCRVATTALTSTDLAHGPIAAVDSQFPVLAITSLDDALPAVLSALDRARRAGATIVLFGNAAGLVDGVTGTAPVPSVPLPVLSPIMSIVPGQLFADSLARARGLNPDLPSGLTKVTLAP